MVPKIGEKYVESGIDIIEELILSEGELIEKEALKMMKHFFNALTGDKLYVDNMDSEQIWEQIDDKLTPLKPILKGRVKKIVRYADEVSLLDLIQSETLNVRLEEIDNETDSLNNDDLEGFSSESEDEDLSGKSLADVLNARARKAGLASYDDASDDEGLMGPRKDEDEDDESDKKKEAGKTEDEEDEDLDFDGEDDFEMEGDMDGEDIDGDEMDGDELDVDEEDEEEDDMKIVDADDEENRLAEEEEIDESKLEQKKRAKALFDEGESFHSLMMRDARLDDELDALERSLVADKHWTMTGEANSLSRPINSLLEQHLELPSYKKADMVQDGQLPDTLGGADSEDGLDFNTRLTQAIEQLVIRRIKDLNFDDVERKVAPKFLRPEEEDQEEVLQFQKSKKSLGELYEEDFRAEMMGEERDTDKETQKQHEAIAALMGKLFFSLDALANHRHMARPARFNESGAPKDMAAMQVEDATPVTMSTSLQKASRELHHVAHEKSSGEMSHDERSALRNAKKRRRAAGLEGKLMEGELSLKGFKERKDKLDAKNHQASKDRESMRKTGLTAAQQEKENFKLNKKINTTELMARAQALNSFKVENKKGMGPKLTALRAKPKKAGGKK